jgi:sugar phosphate isomerase/epimerase
MKIGLFTATFLDTPIEDVFKMASGLGYEAVEMPAFCNNPHLDIEEVVKGNNAAALRKR